MPDKAEAFLVPYDHGREFQGAWGPPPYWRIGITARGRERALQDQRQAHPDSYYMSIEMLSTLHQEIGAVLAKAAHETPAQQ